MEYTAVYEPDTQACGVLDLQLLNRYLEPSVSIDALLTGSGISAPQLYAPDTHITLAQKLAVFSNALGSIRRARTWVKSGTASKVQ